MQLQLQDLRLDNVDALEALKLTIQVSYALLPSLDVYVGTATRPKGPG